MRAPRNEGEFNAQARPHERVAVKFAGAMRPSRCKPRRRPLMQRFFEHPFFNIFRWIP